RRSSWKRRTSRRSNSSTSRCCARTRCLPCAERLWRSEGLRTRLGAARALDARTGVQSGRTRFPEESYVVRLARFAVLVVAPRPRTRAGALAGPWLRRPGLLGPGRRTGALLHRVARRGELDARSTGRQAPSRARAGRR